MTASELEALIIIPLVIAGITGTLYALNSARDPDYTIRLREKQEENQIRENYERFRTRGASQNN